MLPVSNCAVTGRGPSDRWRVRSDLARVLDVKTLTRPPQTPVMPRGFAEAPRRWPVRFLIFVLVLLLVAALGSTMWLRAYQPLTTGTGFYGVQPDKLVTSSIDVNGWRDGAFTQTAVRFDRGETIRVGVPIWNSGTVPVTVTGPFGNQLGERSPVTVEIAGTGPMTGAQSGTMTDTFTGFRLAPGATMQLFVDIGMRHLEPGIPALINTISLDFNAGWTQHTTRVFLQQTIEICNPRCDAAS